MNKIHLLLIAALFLFLSCSPKNQAQKLTVLEGSTMGTFYTVKLLTSDLHLLQINSDSLKFRIDSLLQHINRLMSTYQDDSEISEFNNYQETDWYEVSPELAYVVDYAQKASEQSEGAFDITVGPLVNLWGFGPEDRTTLIPTPEEIEARKKWVGFTKVQVRLNPPAIMKENKEIYIDLSATAKGYGVDRIVEYFLQLGLGNFMVDIGGEIRTRGRNAGDVPWKIGVAVPDKEFGIQKVIPLEDKAVATSGDYRNYFEEGGRRYSHTIDPRTGKPITHHLASVTVVHDTCMVADGLATAINVMGPERGYSFAIKRELSVLFIVRENERFVEQMTPQFQELLKKNRNRY